jgi:hypothetical protein
MNGDMEFETTETEDLRELEALLFRIVQRMTHRLFTTPRLTQLDVGHAISLAQRVDFPQASKVRKALPDLLRELGKKRPDLHRYILLLEEAARELHALNRAAG